MTALAAYLSRQIISRPKHREGLWLESKNIANLRICMTDIHCFEVTACFPLLDELANQFKAHNEQWTEKLFETFAFLPAPKTWIEWRHNSGNRLAVLLEESSNSPLATATCFFKQGAANLGHVSTVSDDHYFCGGEMVLPTFLTGYPYEKTTIAGQAVLQTAHCILLLINSPRIIGRRQHMPNVGLERRLTKEMGRGAFPLHAWTEILLQVNKPVEIDDGEPHEAHLTGRRALHFVRKHIRIRLGQLEYVSAHWRGDAALGIKQQRYLVRA